MADKQGRIRIAFFTVDWNYELVENTLHGLLQYTVDHPEVQVCVFDCFGKDIGNDKDRSEYSVFRLPELSSFDGILVQSNQIILREAREEVEQLVLNSGIPAVAIGCELAGCTLVHFDNRQAQCRMAEHIILEHGARRLVYLTGNMDNNCPEGLERLEGFRDACRDNGIPDSNTEIIRATWRTSDGISVARRWIRNREPLPDAFICANDEMALGLMETLQENGVRVPRDVLVCGFDNLTSAELSSPRLSTVHADHSKLDYFAADVLLRLIRKENLPARIPFDFELICSESCGCHNAPRRGVIRDLYFQQTRFLRSFYVQQDQMAEDLFEAEDLPDLMRVISKNHTIFGCDDIYLCINEYYFDNYDKSMWPNYAESFDTTMVLYSPDPARHSGGGDIVRFPTSDLLPRELMEQESFLMFYPLHYNTYSIGYLVLDGICTAAKLNLHESILNFLEIAIENVRKKSLLHNLNDTLDDLYVHDALTGLYNRFGLARFGQQRFDDLLASEGSVQVLFIDMDDMKSINDRFGHETGDAALKLSARILQRTCSADAFIMRYGGDEFIIIDTGRIRHLDERIQEAANDYNRSSGMPFTLSFSIGLVRTGSEKRLPMDDCINAADSLMYKVKQKKKAAFTGRQPSAKPKAGK
ncbi:MAG: GGDEF domain-containing protein [Clostridia bacterium]|nr:GGDEF domain-containing protein [Clostridia bacterium]